MTKSLAVLLTVFNRKDTTLNCLRNLSRQNIPEGVSYDVWLTDDGCTDGTPEAVSKEFPEVHIINGDGTLFWNRGMWTAWDAASKYKDYDYYLWLNDDTDLYAHALGTLLETSQTYDNKSNIIGSTQFHDHRGVSYGGFINNSTVVPNGFPKEVETFNGNIVLVPRAVFRAVGNLDHYYHHGHGDTDYGYRTRKHGLKNIIAGTYLGECDRHSKLKKCWDPQYSIIERFKDLNKPNSYPPKENFYFQRNHFGLLNAFYRTLTLYARVLLPGLWIKLGRARK